MDPFNPFNWGRPAGYSSEAAQDAPPRVMQAESPPRTGTLPWGMPSLPENTPVVTPAELMSTLSRLAASYRPDRPLVPSIVPPVLATPSTAPLSPPSGQGKFQELDLMTRHAHVHMYVCRWLKVFVVKLDVGPTLCVVMLESTTILESTCTFLTHVPCVCRSALRRDNAKRNTEPTRPSTPRAAKKTRNPHTKCACSQSTFLTSLSY